MRFSVIVPFFNSSDTIARLLDSIPDEPFIEIIIIDDCSKRDEFLRLKRIVDFSRKRVLIKRTEINSGAGSARNVGLDIASGQWLIFADADDYFTPEFLTAMKKYGDSDADVVYFNATSIKLPEGIRSYRHVQIKKWVDGKQENELRYAFHGPVCKFIKTSLIKKNDIHFFESWAFNDALFSAKVGYYAQKIEIDTLPIYCITETSNSTTYTISEKILLSRIDATIAVNAFYHKVGIKKYDMPIFPHWIYSRKLGVKGFLKVLWKILRYKENPFKV